MKRRALVAALCFVSATPAVAQERFSAQPYVGALVTDGPFEGFEELTPPPGPPPPPSELDTTTGLLLGARLGWQIRPSWTIEGAYGHSSYATEVTIFVTTVLNPEGVEQTFEFTEHTAHLYYGAIRHDFSRGTVRPFLSAGAGGVTTSTSFGEDALDVLFDLHSVTDPVLVLGAGLAIEAAPRTRVRSDFKDLIRFCSADFCDDENALHNLEISGGIEIAF